MKRFSLSKRIQGRAMGLAIAAVAGLPGPVFATEFLITARNADTTYRWDSDTNLSSVFHTVRSNDADYNGAEGSSEVWFVEHFNDDFGYYAPGSGSGVDADFNVSYNYPKHVTVYNDFLHVMSRNDGTIQRYEFDGTPVSSKTTGFGTGQGMATDGTSLFVSVWSGSVSSFQRYDSNLVLQESFPNPTGLTGNNIYDFAYDSSTGRFFGLVTSGEGGTGTQSSTVVEFTMGGSVLSTRDIGFNADGIGQYTVPEPGSLAVCGIGMLLLSRRRGSA